MRYPRLLLFLTASMAIALGSLEPVLAHDGGGGRGGFHGGGGCHGGGFHSGGGYRGGGFRGAGGESIVHISKGWAVERTTSP